MVARLVELLHVVADILRSERFKCLQVVGILVETEIVILVDDAEPVAVALLRVVL